MGKLSKFLKQNGLPALANAAAGNPIGAITALFGITGGRTEESIINALESNSEVIYKLKEKELELVGLIMEDRKSARRMNIEVNKSEQASWITKNVAAIIALLWMGFCMFLYWTSLKGAVGEDQQMNASVVGSITNITMLIVGFYFGSSEKNNSKH